MMTSGTTSRPKVVPLTHANIIASARNISRVLSLAREDRICNVMPLFYGHGLITCVLTPLITGGSVLCTGGFDALRFFQWLRDGEPTWISAAPSIFQAVLERAQARPDQVTRGRLRLLRTGSAPLAAPVMTRLEELFAVPVIETYGTTETTTQLTSNPLPPGLRKAGSTGKPAGPEVRVIDDQGISLPPGETGEVIARGDSIMHGYEGGAEANAGAFFDGWFRTGDLGYFDAEGYLFLTGRRREMINKGGEKIAPREVDEVLLQHPAVAEAATFPLPDPRLGLTVAAAVVLRAGAKVSESDMIAFAATRLIAYKLPSRVLFVDRLVERPGGKLQRSELASRLGPSALEVPATVQPPVPARDATEEQLVRIWQSVLHLDRVGTHDNFFHLGGDSLSARSLLVEIERAFGRRLQPHDLYRAQTCAKLAEVLRREVATGSIAGVLPLHIGPRMPPLFLMTYPGGNLLEYRAVLAHSDPRQMIYGFKEVDESVRYTSHLELTEFVASCLKDLITVQPEGPYCLCGYSYGGILVFELARQLCAQGREIGLLIVIDAPCPGQARPLPLLRRFRNQLRNLSSGSLRERWKAGVDQLKLAWDRFVSRWKWSFRTKARAFWLRVGTGEDDRTVNPLYCRPYRALPYPGSLLLFRSEERTILDAAQDKLGWDAVALGGVTRHVVEGDHGSMLREPGVRVLAACLEDHLSAVRRRE